MKVEEILETQQPDVHKKLNQNRNKKRRGENKKENLSFSDVLGLMQRDSYTRGKGGAIRQKTWGG